MKIDVDKSEYYTKYAEFRQYVVEFFKKNGVDMAIGLHYLQVMTISVAQHHGADEESFHEVNKEMWATRLKEIAKGDPS